MVLTSRNLLYLVSQRAPFLTPLLFSSYSNDISATIESGVRHFAGDCVCCREIKEIENTVKLQKDIDGLGSYTRNCQMQDDAADKKA